MNKNLRHRIEFCSLPAVLDFRVSLMLVSSLDRLLWLNIFTARLELSVGIHRSSNLCKHRLRDDYAVFFMVTAALISNPLVIKDRWWGGALLFHKRELGVLSVLNANRGIVWVGRDLWMSSSTTPCCEQRHLQLNQSLQLLAQSLLQTDLERFQGWSSCHLSEQSVPPSLLSSFDNSS